MTKPWSDYISKEKIEIKPAVVKNYLSDGRIQMTMTQCKREGDILNNTYSSRIVRGDPACDRYRQVRENYVTKVQDTAEHMCLGFEAPDEKNEKAAKLTSLSRLSSRASKSKKRSTESVSVNSDDDTLATMKAKSKKQKPNCKILEAVVDEYDDIESPPKPKKKRTTSQKKTKVTPSPKKIFPKKSEPEGLICMLNPPEDPTVGRLVLTVAKRLLHPAFECDFVSASYMVLGATVPNGEKNKEDEGKQDVHWQTVEKGLAFVDIRTGIHRAFGEKVNQYVEFGPIDPSHFLVLCERTDGDVSKLNSFLLPTLSQFNFSCIFGWRKNILA